MSLNSAAYESGAGAHAHPGREQQHAVTGQLGAMQLGTGSSSSSGDPSSSTAGMRSHVHCFTEQAPDATIHFQIIDLGLQLYIWVAVGGAKLQNMYLAIQSKQVWHGAHFSWWFNLGPRTMQPHPCPDACSTTVHTLQECGQPHSQIDSHT